MSSKLPEGRERQRGGLVFGNRLGRNVFRGVFLTRPEIVCYSDHPIATLFLYFWETVR